jgi:hypothetical protein
MDFSPVFDSYPQFTWLAAQEEFIEFSYPGSFKSYIEMDY